jgi:hypothetical protein
MADDKKVRRRMIRLSVVDSSPGASLCAVGPPGQPRSRETAARLRTGGRKSSVLARLVCSFRRRLDARARILVCAPADP